MNRRAKLSAVGLSFHESNLEIRVKALETLPIMQARFFKTMNEYIVLTTCNRVEVFLFDDMDPEQVQNEWASLCETKTGFVSFRDFEAVKHLFRVTASLESMVVGETQITGQVKEAYEKARAAGTAGSILNKLFQGAFRVAKKIRSETEVGRFPVSIPSIAVKLAEKVVGPIHRKRVGIVGLGEMGRLAAEYFASGQPQKLFLLNRSASKANDLATKLRAEGVKADALTNIEDLMNNSDVIVSAISGELELSDIFFRSLTQRIFIDLSVPPSLKAAQTPEHYYFGIDDLRKIAEENQSFRRAEIERAEEIIQKETDRFWISLRAFFFHDLFENLESKVKGIREEELKALRSRLSDSCDSDWIEIEKTAERMVNRVLQEPMRTVKYELETSEETETEGVVSFFRHLFKV